MDEGENILRPLMGKTITGVRAGRTAFSEVGGMGWIDIYLDDGTIYSIVLSDGAIHVNWEGTS